MMIDHPELDGNNTLQGMPDTTLVIDSLQAFVFRVPLKQPRKNAFGTMNSRPALVVRIRDADGAEGWGEAFCNWPSFAAEYRYQVLTEILQPKLLSTSFDHPKTLQAHLYAGIRALRIQCDDRGAFDHSIAAIDIAAWDLLSRRSGQPLWRLLRGEAYGDQLPETNRAVPVYASSITASNLDDIVGRHRARGVNAFKLKVGFGREQDQSTLARLRSAAGDEARLMVDANQAWTPIDAIEEIKSLSDFGLDWVEEPIGADLSWESWRQLADLSPVPLAAGENVRGDQEFEDMMRIGRVKVVQPDPIKWGGLTSALNVGRSALSRNEDHRFCPHYLGGGIGLMATIHLLAAFQGNGILELDGSENLLREYLASPYPELRDGAIQLSDEPGLGVAPDWKALSPFQVSL